MAQRAMIMGANRDLMRFPSILLLRDPDESGALASDTSQKKQESSDLNFFLRGV